MKLRITESTFIHAFDEGKRKFCFRRGTLKCQTELSKHYLSTLSRDWLSWCRCAGIFYSFSEFVLTIRMRSWRVMDVWIALAGWFMKYEPFITFHLTWKHVNAAFWCRHKFDRQWLNAHRTTNKIKTFNNNNNLRVWTTKFIRSAYLSSAIIIISFLKWKRQAKERKKEIRHQGEYRQIRNISKSRSSAIRPFVDTSSEDMRGKAKRWHTQCMNMSKSFWQSVMWRADVLHTGRAIIFCVSHVYLPLRAKRAGGSGESPPLIMCQAG